MAKATQMRWMAEVCSGATVSASLGPAIQRLLAPKFAYALGGVPDRYEWEFIPMGGLLFYDWFDRPVLAERDTVNLWAIRNMGARDG